jgi:CheY-like chemotaxis protein
MASPTPHIDVLVIDDDRGIRETLGGVLLDEGYTVRLVRNGAEALEFLRSESAPSLILLDVSMPVLDGPGFRAQQLKDGALASIPVVVLTAGGPHDDEAQGVPGAAGFLRKPFGLSQLLDTVGAFCPRLAAAHS